LMVTSAFGEKVPGGNDGNVTRQHDNVLSGFPSNASYILRASFFIN